MLQFPLSLDNKPEGQDYYAKEWLDPNGENGKHRLAGGYLRDRPLNGGPKQGDFIKVNYLHEIKTAQSAGISGFMVNLQNVSGPEWDRFQVLLGAADEVNFHIVPTIDATTEFSQLPPDEVGRRLAPVFAHPSVQASGEAPVLASFATEKKEMTWWRDVISTLEAKTGSPVDFHATLVDSSSQNISSVAPLAKAIGTWGGRTPSDASKQGEAAQRVRDLDREWIAPVAAQDVRPTSGLYAEAENTATLRQSWSAAHDHGAEWTQLITWNDYAEGTQLAPSRNNQGAWLAMIRRLADVGDGDSPQRARQVVLTYRPHQPGAKATRASRSMHPTLGGAAVRPRNQVEVVTFLPHEEKVRLTVGEESYEYVAPAGTHVELRPARPGRVSVQLGATPDCHLQATSPIVAKPLVQDLSYHADWIECS
ncbi:endo-1,3-alpha-glucanase family glycosylhydrolase [Luteococcus sp. OSA5]|uniref:endo-1,3-alpha-glucanase family glycosylhydrolase n=1 Tax=Luteococcus sp. OSA5 TaxID=3401630 RepID=UPI003B433FA6